MKIPDFTKDGIRITYNKYDNRSCFNVNGKVITFGGTKTWGKQEIIMMDICILNLEEFYVFKQYYQSIEKLLFLWFRRPESFENQGQIPLTESEFYELLNWTALEEKDIQDLKNYLNYFFEKKADFVSEEKEERELKTCVYLMKDEMTNYIKIGRSRKPEFREKTLLAQTPKITLICYWKNCSNNDESYLHNLFAEQRKRGEWFDLEQNHLDSITEYFKGKEVIEVY